MSDEDIQIENELIEQLKNPILSEQERYTLLGHLGKANDTQIIDIISTVLSIDNAQALIKLILFLRKSYQEMGKVPKPIRALYADTIRFYIHILLTLLSAQHAIKEIKYFSRFLLSQQDDLLLNNIEVLATCLPVKLFAELKEVLLPKVTDLSFQQDFPSIKTIRQLLTMDIWIRQLTQCMLDVIPGDFSMVQKENVNCQNVDTILFLKSVAIFKDIPAPYLANVAEISQEFTYPAGEYLFQEGDQGDSLFIIRSGVINIIRNEKVIAEMKEGDCLGELSLLDHLPRSAGALVIENARLLKINAFDFENILTTYPEVARCLLHLLATRLRNTTKYLTA